MRDYQESVTTGQTHRWTDRQTDRRWTKWSLCATMLCRRHKKGMSLILTLKYNNESIEFSILQTLMPHIKSAASRFGTQPPSSSRTAIIDKPFHSQFFRPSCPTLKELHHSVATHLWAPVEPPSSTSPVTLHRLREITVVVSMGTGHQRCVSNILLWQLCLFCKYFIMFATPWYYFVPLCIKTNLDIVLFLKFIVLCNQACKFNMQPCLDDGT